MFALVIWGQKTWLKNLPAEKLPAEGSVLAPEKAGHKKRRRSAFALLNIRVYHKKENTTPVFFARYQFILLNISLLQ
ncbi:MAG: hypothetical protein KDC66_05415 [Phaeodactylibacter sp.]|nr:hypothetical protein [Phaeodactylibacter sp.]MCB9276416.1 hypothetical protein [Lewinellaceae bacterium]